MFYKTGIDITNDKQMFNFLKKHFEYYTMNSWNRLASIANNVKLYKLDLRGDWRVAYDLLSNGEYDTISFMIDDWRRRNYPAFEVMFNGRSDGYLVLMNANNSGHVLPDEIVESEDYEEYKRYCKKFYGSVKANRDTLVYYTKLVQSFDKLCDDLREFCNELSQQTFEIVEMNKAVDQFNDEYADDLEYLEFSSLRCEEDGSVDISEISSLCCLVEAFKRIVDRSDYGYSLKWDHTTSKVRLAKNNF